MTYPVHALTQLSRSQLTDRLKNHWLKSQHLDTLTRLQEFCGLMKSLLHRYQPDFLSRCSDIGSVQGQGCTD